MTSIENSVYYFVKNLSPIVQGKTLTVEIPKFYEDQVFCFLDGGFLIF